MVGHAILRAEAEALGNEGHRVKVPVTTTEPIAMISKEALVAKAIHIPVEHDRNSTGILSPVFRKARDWKDEFLLR